MKSFEYKKLQESIALEEAHNNFGFMIKKFDFVPRRILDQILLEGGRRADSKLIETDLNSLDPKSDWAFTGIEQQHPNSISQAAIVYDYLDKKYKYVHLDGSITTTGSWENALELAKKYFKGTAKVYLLDSHRKVRLSAKTRADILVSRR